MAQPLQSINLIAPGFKGLNTEDSPLAQEASYADVADNAVIDERGRIAARKGVNLLTTDDSELGSDYIHKIHHFYDKEGDDNSVIFSVGNNKIFSGTSTLVDHTDGNVNSDMSGYTITANNWKIINFNDKCYFFQRGYEPLIYDSTQTYIKPASAVSIANITSAQYGHEAIAAYGRLWVVDNASEATTIYWSDLLIPDFAGGSSGSIDVTKAWPDGFDEVRALAAHNNALIIFGNHSIIVYQNANSPANMSIADTVSGVGCVCRNSVQSIGTDVLFMSHSGLRSFGRTIQEKSMPLTDLSRNVKQELISVIQDRSAPTSSVYSPENNFYLITFPSENLTYCFDIRGTVENGSYRVTTWPTPIFKCFARHTDGTLYIGTASGVGKHYGYTDQSLDANDTVVDDTYRFKYYSPGLSFGDSSKIKMVKKIKPTIIGSSLTPVFVKWAYDFGTDYKTEYFTASGAEPAYYGVALYGNSPDSSTPPVEFTEAEYTGGTKITRKSLNATGNGTVVTVGVESDIAGSPFSVQEINVLALIGKTL